MTLGLPAVPQVKYCVPGTSCGVPADRVRQGRKSQPEPRRAQRAPLADGDIEEEFEREVTGSGHFGTKGDGHGGPGNE